MGQYSDDNARQRAKIKKRIFAVSKIFDKMTGGWFHGQTMVLLFLVTGKVSLLVGFRFHQPDPVVAVWKKTDDALKQQGVENPTVPRSRNQAPRIRVSWICCWTCCVNFSVTTRTF